MASVLTRGFADLLFGRVEVRQEGRVLAEQILDLGDAGTGPVLDPRLGEVVRNEVEAAIAHASMIGTRPAGSMGRTAHFRPASGLARSRRLSGPWPDS